MIKRTLENQLDKIVESFPAVLITGARQVGKSTLLENFIKNYKRIDGRTYSHVTLDDVDEMQKATSDPKLFLADHKPPVFIDEIQYAPNLFRYIKIHIDEHKEEKGLFLLTGSQKYLLMKNVQESLAGRIAIIELLGLSNREICDDSNYDAFLPDDSRACPAGKAINADNIYERIFSGSFPMAFDKDDKTRNLYFSSYIQSYLNRDVKDIISVKNIMSFNGFLKAIAARTGCLLNYNDLSRDCAIDGKTARSWLGVLEATGLIRLLHPYHNNMTKRITKTPKIYFLDTGLCAYLSGWNTVDSLKNGAMSGSILETYALSEILKSYHHNATNPSIYFYRDRDGREIDFIIEDNNALYPVEVKRTMMPDKKCAKNFTVLEKLNVTVPVNTVLCLKNEFSHISENMISMPIWSI